MPSIAIFTTPLRSEITPPRAGSKSSAANCRVDCQRSQDGNTLNNTCKNTGQPSSILLELLELLSPVGRDCAAPPSVVSASCVSPGSAPFSTDALSFAG